MTKNLKIKLKFFEIKPKISSGEIAAHDFLKFYIFERCVCRGRGSLCGQQGCNRTQGRFL